MDRDVRMLGPADNEALLALVRSCVVRARLRLPWPGTTVLRPERSPDYFAFLGSLGGEARVLGVLHDGDLVATASVIRRSVRWNGDPREADYVGDLRVHPDHRRSSVLHPLLRAVRGVSGRTVPAYVFVLEENEEALALLRGRRGLRRYEVADRILHLAFLTALPLRSPSGYRVVEATPALEETWRRSFALWSRDRNLAPAVPPPRLQGERRFLAIREGRPVAVGSVLDHTPVRRLVAESLCLRDRILRRAVNALARLTRSPRMAGEGEPLRRAYLGNVVHDPARPHAARALLAAGLRAAREAGAPLLYLGLSERDPALPAIQPRRSVHRTTTLLLTHGLTPTPGRCTLVNLHEI